MRECLVCVKDRDPGSNALSLRSTFASSAAAKLDATSDVITRNLSVVFKLFNHSAAYLSKPEQTDCDLSAICYNFFFDSSAIALIFSLCALLLDSFVHLQTRGSDMLLRILHVKTKTFGQRSFV